MKSWLNDTNNAAINLSLLFSVTRLLRQYYLIYKKYLHSYIIPYIVFLTPHNTTTPRPPIVEPRMEYGGGGT